MLQEEERFDDTELSEEERGLLERALKGELPDEFIEAEIPKREVLSPVPLSYPQQRLWVLDRLVPGNPFYNTPWALQLTGKPDIKIFQRCLNEIIRRHEALRTVFTMEQEHNEPVQVILPELNLRIELLDLRQLPGEKQWEEIVRLARREAGRAFDLEQGPLLRVSLLQRSEEEYILLIVLHHIIFDGWSLGVLVKELGGLYDAFIQGKPSPLPGLSIQYADFALWQRKRVQGEELAKQLAFWKKLLGGELPIMELPVDRQRPAIPTYRGQYLTCELPADTGAKLLELGREQGCSIFMTLLAALNVLLYRYCHQEDLLVGSPIANRNRPELEPLIGYFSNTLVFRTPLSGNPSFLELQARVRSMTAEVYDNQDLPFEKLVEEFQPDRYMSHTPFFQVMAHYGSSLVKGGGTFGELAIASLPLFTQTSKFDLWFNLSPQRYGIEYNSDIFAESTIKRMMRHFNTLLAGIGANPDLSIAELPVLPDDEKEQILFQWNDTRREYEIQSLHHRFEAQVERTPDNIAVVAPPQKKNRTYMTYMTHISYRELNENSDQMAGLLKEKGVQTGGIAGIMMERSVEMVIGLLAILKAGGAYLPLDPEYPAERIAYLLADSSANTLVTTRSLAKEEETLKGLEVKGGHETILIDTVDFSGFSSSPLLNLSSSPSSLAYLIYTSGSTGQPRGVMISHAGISNRLSWMQEAYRLTSLDRVLQKTPYSFDVSVWEFFWPLLNGAVLVMARPGGHKDSAYLVETIVKEKITTIHFVPAMLNVFLEEPGLEKICSLKRVICSGEALPVEYRERFFNGFRETALHNLYGPTEASVDVTAWECKKESHLNTVPLGKPMANTRIYILDRYLNPVPIGVHGELHIGGIQLARGYLNNPGLTAEKFCLRRPGGALFEKTAPPGPPGKNVLFNQKLFQGVQGDGFLEKSPPGRRRQKIYRTGDLARWLPDGNIEFLGRLDFQVKVRGFRIELGEIESKLRSHDLVEDAVVTVTEGVSGKNENKLTAYIILNHESWNLIKNKSGEDLAGHQVFEWQEVFDDTYKQGPPGQDPAFDFSGWNSSYTGEPIPAPEMRQWVDYTVERILSLKPARVLEIGCGTGLLLFRILPHCQSYQGTEISKKGLDYIRHQLLNFKENAHKVELAQKRADDFRGLETSGCDLVILNSVVQYFPGPQYLLKVLKGAIDSVKPGGTIFIGDVRSLPLLKAFHTSVEWRKAEPGATKNQLHRRVVNRLRRENELVIDPAFFMALQEPFPRVKQVECHLKRGRYRNELTRFRYDVILRIDVNTGENPAMELSYLDWHRRDLTLPAVRQLLQEKEPRHLGMTRVPNARTSKDLRVLSWLESRDRIETLGQFRQAPVENRGRGIDPEEFYRLAEELSYDVDITLEPGSPGTYGVVFKHRGSAGLSPGPLKNTGAKAAEIERASRGPLHTYTNNPLLSKISAEAAPELRAFLKEKLPEYMVPSYFVLLEKLPLTPNGKLDRKALLLHEPLPAAFTAEPGKGPVKPRTPLEKFLAKTWKEVLLIDELGIDDNFFQLGGDSINAIQVISRINKQGYNLSVRHLYLNMTIAQMADYVERHKEELILTPEAPENPGILEKGLKIDRKQLLDHLPPGTELEDIYPLTPFQKHMLAYYLNPPPGWDEPGLFVNQVIIPLPLASADIPVVEKAFQDLTDVYPYLRTAFMWEHGGEPVQVIYKQVKARFRYRDLSHLSAAEGEKQVKEIIAADHDLGFARNKANVYRICIIRLLGDKFLMLQTSDLMRVDGWSAMIVTGKFIEHTRALANGQILPLEPPDTAYKEFVSRLSRQEADGEDDYWRKLVRGCGVPTPLVARAPQNTPEKRGTQGFTAQHIYFSREETLQIDEFLKRHQIVLSALGSGTWSLLLSHYTGLKKVVLGMLFSGRGSARPGVETMVGQAMNVLPLRVDLPGTGTSLAWLKEIMATLIELNNHDFQRQDRVRELWQVPAELPLFESYFVLENFPGVKESKRSGILPSSRDTGFEFIAQMEYPLRVELFPLLELRLSMHYYRRCFTGASIEVMLKDFRTLLLRMIKNPYGQVEELRLLD